MSTATMDLRHQQEEEAWGELRNEPVRTSHRLKWTRILDRVHAQVDGPLVIAYIASEGWPTGWHLSRLEEDRMRKGNGRSKEFRTDVWARVMAGEHLSGPWPQMSGAKSEAAWRFGADR